jgi:hypothetical protein
VLTGRVWRINKSDANGTIAAVLELTDPLPERTRTGAKIGALIDVGVAKEANSG